MCNTKEYLFMENQTNIQVGDIIDGEVVRIEQYGAFVRVADRRNGLVHISQLADEFVKNVADYVQVGDVITVKVINVDENGRISLSRKDVDAE
ncbi:MAG: S1 RNA-binding domain-containing protein [Culicoidibacterales bacterium]